MAISPDSKSQPTPTKTALLVEDERSTLRFYAAGLKGLQEFRTLSAENGREALALLQSNRVDVVVTDLNMPILDGYGLIAILNEKYPSLPIIVITSVVEPGLLTRAVELGALRILSKPPKLSVLMEEIRSAVAQGPQGIVQGLGLSSLLQLLNWERRTATLTVDSQGAVGFLYVKDGQLIQAAREDLEGLEAAYEILGWEGAHVEFVGTCRVQAVIDLPITEILMNAALARDARREDAPSPAAPLRPEVDLDQWHG